MAGIRLLSVEEARARMLAQARPLPTQDVPVGVEALDLVLAQTVTATRDQPPFPAAAMDGYAVAAGGLTDSPQTLKVIGESAAGRGFGGAVGESEAVRIFTGAPVPSGAAWVVPQENARRDADRVEIAPRDQSSAYIRAQGVDFRSGQILLSAGSRLDPWRIGLAAAAGLGLVSVHRRPRVAVLSTGEELAAAGGPVGPDEIYDSGSPALSALITKWGAVAIRLAPAGDKADDIAHALRDVAADLVVTIGGASVGDHDLVKPAMGLLGLELKVESVAVRPGKPTWFGLLGDGRLVLGLPGNPASALVCAELFLKPLLDAMQGVEAPEPRLIHARTTQALPANGGREHWMRASLSYGPDGALLATPLKDQDSSLLTVYSAADALLRRSVNASGAAPGDVVQALPLQRA